MPERGRGGDPSRGQAPRDDEDKGAKKDAHLQDLEPLTKHIGDTKEETKEDIFEKTQEANRQEMEQQKQDRLNFLKTKNLDELKKMSFASGGANPKTDTLGWKVRAQSSEVEDMYEIRNVNEQKDEFDFEKNVTVSLKELAEKNLTIRTRESWTKLVESLMKPGEKLDPKSTYQEPAGDKGERDHDQDLMSYEEFKSTLLKEKVAKQDESTRDHIRATKAHQLLQKEGKQEGYDKDAIEEMKAGILKYQEDNYEDVLAHVKSLGFTGDELPKEVKDEATERFLVSYLMEKGLDPKKSKNFGRNVYGDNLSTEGKAIKFLMTDGKPGSDARGIALKEQLENWASQFE